ncbi:MAG: site-specific integrase, partial [Bacteroides sp.]
MFVILFYIRKDKVNKKGDSPVYMFITINKLKVEYVTGERIASSIWNEGRIKGYLF